MRILVIAALTAMLASVPGAVPARPSTAPAPAAAVAELLGADRRFSEEAAKLRGAEGLARMFDEDVVIFAAPVPGFAVGKAAAGAALERALGIAEATTQWAPIRGGISADGTHGFTFGYMTSRAEGRPALLAKYVSYWVKSPAGWRVKLFKRVPRPDGPVSLAPMAPSLPKMRGGWRGRPASVAASRQSLREREQAFSDDAQKIGLSAAFARYGRTDSVNVGGDAAFVVSAAEIAKILPPTSPLRWSADQGVIVAPSGDLGVTWGYLHRTSPPPPGRLAEIPFFTIWRRDGLEAPWHYIAE